VTKDPEVTQKFRFIKPATDTIQAGARLIPTIPEFSEAMLQVTQNLQRGLTGEVTIPEALKRAQKVMQDLMTEKGYYRRSSRAPTGAGTRAAVSAEASAPS
jgi:hypothetical protein